MRDEKSKDSPTGAVGGMRQEAADGVMSLPAGTRLDNRYVIEDVLAAGGFGITYLARHEALAKTYAIKEHFPRQFAYRDAATSGVRPTNPATFQWALDRFIQEGRSLARCKHPSVVDVSDVFEANGTAYMVLSYEDGLSFKVWLEGLGRRPTQSELDALLSPLLDALQFVHAQDLLHRDIAPDNIMIRTDGKPCLIDFGAARQALAQRSAMMSAIVKTGFSPPEQYTTTGRSQGPWSDIYALAATLYKALTGRVPQEATDRQLQDDVAPLARQLGGDGGYRTGFLDAIDHALALRPADRPQSVEAWRPLLFGPAIPKAAAAVASASEPVTIAAPSALPAGSTALKPKRSASRIRVAVIAGCAALLCGAAYLAVSAQKSADERAFTAVAESTRRVQEAASLAQRDGLDRHMPVLRSKLDAQRRQVALEDSERLAREAKRKIDEEQRAEEARRTQAAQREAEARRIEEEKQAEARRIEAARQAEARRLDDERLAAERARAAIPPPSPPIDTAALRRDIFRELKRVGCDPGQYNGQWSSGLRRALDQFVTLTNVKVATDLPSPDLLAAITARKARVCPLKCDDDEEVSGDRCVTKVVVKSVPKPQPSSPPPARKETKVQAEPRGQKEPQGGGGLRSCNSWPRPRFGELCTGSLGRSCIAGGGPGSCQ